MITQVKKTTLVLFLLFSLIFFCSTYSPVLSVHLQKSDKKNASSNLETALVKANQNPSTTLTSIRTSHDSPTFFDRHIASLPDLTSLPKYAYARALLTTVGNKFEPYDCEEHIIVIRAIFEAAAIEQNWKSKTVLTNALNVAKNAFISKKSAITNALLALDLTARKLQVERMKMSVIVNFLKMKKDEILGIEYDTLAMGKIRLSAGNQKQFEQADILIQKEEELEAEIKGAWSEAVDLIEKLLEQDSQPELPPDFKSIFAQQTSSYTVSESDGIMRGVGAPEYDQRARSSLLVFPVVDDKAVTDSANFAVSEADAMKAAQISRERRTYFDNRRNVCSVDDMPCELDEYVDGVDEDTIARPGAAAELLSDLVGLAQTIQATLIDLVENVRDNFAYSEILVSQVSSLFEDTLGRSSMAD